MLDRHRLILRRDGLLNRHDVHADACASGRHHRRDLLQRQERHLVKAPRQLRVRLHLREHHVGHLRNAGHKLLHIVLLFVRRIFPIVLHSARPRGLLQHLFHALRVLAGDTCDLCERLRLAQPHLEHDLRRLVGDGAIQNHTLRIVHRKLLDSQLIRNAVRDHCPQLQNQFSFFCHNVLFPLS